VSQEKWDKAKRLINLLWDVIEQGGADINDSKLGLVELDFKELEITWGFLVHLSMTLDMLTHHLKGFHLALSSFLPKWREDGWKTSEVKWLSYLWPKVERGLIATEEAETLSTKSRDKAVQTPPQSIHLIQHLKDDIYALREFFDSPIPHEVQARRQAVHMILYGFADASGGGSAAL
jgi:hypothetical protein